MPDRTHVAEGVAKEKTNSDHENQHAELVEPASADYLLPFVFTDEPAQQTDLRLRAPDFRFEHSRYCV
ncbi:MAG: hypothetical protein WAM05_09885 [Candidatus Binataceae bacterium]